MVMFDFTNPFTRENLEGSELGRRSIFLGERPDFLRTGQQQNIFGNMFNRIQDEFLREIGQSFARGEAPQQTFTDFVRNRDLERQVRREGLGRQTSPLVSAARFLFDR